MDKKILKQLKSDYEELEINPSADLWNKIETGLDSTSKTVQKPRFQWLKYVAVIAFLISAGSFFYFNSDKPFESEKTIARKVFLENNLKPAEKFETIIPTEDKIENSTANEILKNKFLSEKVFEKPAEFIEPPEMIKFTEKPDEIKVAENSVIENPEIYSLKPNVTKSKKISYINTDDLLLGRELDKTRIEIKNHRQFGVLDASKLKFKRPSSLQIFGVQVFSDSIVSE